MGGRSRQPRGGCFGMMHTGMVWISLTIKEDGLVKSKFRLLCKTAEIKA
jgi:hypothetical protein